MSSCWSVARKDESQETDYGSMHLNETPSLYQTSLGPMQFSAQGLATRFLERSCELGYLNVVEYQTRMQQLHRAVRLGIDSAATCTDCIVSTLRQLISVGYLNHRWRLVSVDCDHFASEVWEERFGCSYRNTQCVLSALFRLPDFRKRLFGALSAMPSVWKLQALLESAWALGFDPLGAQQVAEMVKASRAQSANQGTATVAASSYQSDSRNLIGLVDSTVWLGVTDLASLFGSIGVRCSVLECRAPSGPDGTHTSLLEHAYSYIQNGRYCSSSFEAFSVPMILQHEGHSRVVIGVELDELERPVALLVLDPNTPAEAMRLLRRVGEDAADPEAEDEAWIDVLQSIRLDASQLVHPQYQLLLVNGLVETEAELQDAMVIENITIAIS